MSNVLIEKDKLDILATAISNKSGEPLKLTLDEMVSAVDGIDTSGGGITPTGNIDITQSGVTDVTNYATATVNEISPLYVDVDVQCNYITKSGQRKWELAPYFQNTGDDGAMVPGYAMYTGNTTTFNAIPTGTTITPTTSSQTVGGANYMMEGAVTVAAMPTGTATAPTTINGTGATVSTGTNTLTLSKTVSNTPQVTAGYVASGTAGNSSVSLTANVTTKGTATITPTTSNQTIASGTYLTGTQTISGDANLVAGNIKSGTTIFGVTGTYSGGGGSSKNSQTAQSTSRATSSAYTEVISLTCSKAGTYHVYWSTFRSSTSGTWGSQLYINDTAHGTAQTGSWSNHIQNIHLTSVSLSANDDVAVRVRTRGNSYYGYVGTLTIIEA